MNGCKSVQVFIHLCDSMWSLWVEANLCRFSFIFVIVCGFYEWKRICAGYNRLFIYVEDPVIIRGLGSDLHGTFFVPVSSQDIDFQRLMSWCFVCAQWSWVQLRWEMIVCFVNILPWHLLGHAIKSVTCFDLQFSCSTRPMTSFCIFLAYINTEGIIFNVKITRWD